MASSPRIRVVRPLADQMRAVGELLGNQRDFGGDVPRLQRTSGSSFRLDTAGRCEAPVHISIEGRQLSPGGVTVVSKVHRNSRALRNAPLFLDVDGRCRRCGPCLKYRRRLWASRAHDEIAWASRTWMGTLTLRPDRQSHFLYVARSKEASRGGDLDTQNPEYIFRRRCEAVGKALTLFFKRLRKKTKCNIRYLAVFEKHASGDPHLHLLLHELDNINVVRKSQLEAEWHEGFSHWRLVDKDNPEAPKSPWYVTKYLAKELTTRVRASLHYGQPAESGMCVSTHVDNQQKVVSVEATEKKTTPKPPVQGLNSKEQNDAQ